MKSVHCWSLSITGHVQQMVIACLLPTRLPQHLTPSTPRELKSGMIKDEQAAEPSPYCSLAPGREHQEKDILSLRVGCKMERWRAPLAGWSPFYPPRWANQATLPSSSPGPHDSALELLAEGLGWLHPYKHSPLLSQSSSLHFVSPFLPLLCHPT